MSAAAKKERSVFNIFFTTYWTFIRKKPRQYFLMVLLSLLPALISPVKVYLERIIFDCSDHILVTAGIDAAIYRVFFLSIAVQLLYVAVYPLFRSHVNYFGSEFETVLQNEMNRKTARIPLKTYERSQLYKDIELASSASRELRFSTMMFSSEILLYLFQFLSVSSVLFTFHPLLVLLSFLALAPDIFAEFLKSKRKYLVEDRTQPILRRKKYYEDILTTLRNIKEVRVHQNGDFFYTLWDREREAYNRENWKLQKKNALLDILNQAVNILTIVLTYGVAAALALRGDISIGVLGASIGAVFSLKSNFGRICRLAMFSFQCSLKGKYYYKVLDYEERGGEARESLSAKGGIHFDGVHFSYIPEKEAVKGISFDIHPGEHIAVVGENGSGKTTMVKLLLGLYQPDAGEIRYGQDPINQVREADIYQNNSAVFQDFCQYALTLEENVFIGDTAKPADRERIKALLDAVSFRFGENTLETPLGREFGGGELSGGNWQKLAIARGLYKSHDVIAFDEPTASLDPLVEEQIIRSMMELDKGSIKVFVTHRLSTTRLSDRIIVMDKGNIAGCGTHEQLIGVNPIYTELWNSQAKWYAR